MPCTLYVIPYTLQPIYAAKNRVDDMPSLVDIDRPTSTDQR
jgi:hypothetical protein